MSLCRNNLHVLIFLLTTIAVKHVSGREVEHRIISGKPAAVGQFPWQVILKKDEIDDLLCGGSIIASNWILTAAHCTYGLSSVFVVFGTILLDNVNALSMTSTKIIVHPRYNAETLNSDVSLIKLPTPLKFTNTIQPISLVPRTQSNNNFLGSTAIIAGFGITDDEYLDYSNVLLYAQVKIIDNSLCETVYGTEVVTEATLCAKGASGSNQSICSGDSGGPLITKDAYGNFMQIGINSFVAQDMCTVGYPSGYVRLTEFLDFISQTMGMKLT